MNTQKFKLNDYTLNVIKIPDKYYPYQTQLFNENGEEVHIGEYSSIRQLCLMIYEEIYIYQGCNDPYQLRLDIYTMNQDLRVFTSGDTPC